MSKTASSTTRSNPEPVAATFEGIAELYAAIGPTMKAVAVAVGQHCEVVLHDLSTRDLNHTIYAIENGHVSGRAVGGPSTNLGLEVLNDEGADHDEFGYRGRTADGRELRCSSVYFRNADGRIIGALCVNIDVTPLQNVQNIMAALLSAPEQQGEQRELVAPDIGTVLDDMISDAIATTGTTVALMDKASRVEVLQILDDRGAFHIKRAVERVAKRLGISKVTAYAYLDQIRSQRADSARHPIV